MSLSPDPSSAAITDLNDAFRRGGTGGQMFLTAGVAELPAPVPAQVVAAVAGFDQFTADNDPYGEHDCAAMQVAGHTIIWKIDYFNLTQDADSDDPGDAAITLRVLTIMLSAEY